MKELSVVVLCFKSGHYAKEFATQISNELETENLNYELVLVGNYIKNSNDKTPEIINELVRANSKFIGITREKKGMMGWDMRLGLEVSKGKYVAVIDGDGQMPTSDILKVYHKIKNGNFDIVKTYRRVRHDGVYRKVLSQSYNFLLRVLFPQIGNIRDVNSKPKILKRSVLNSMDLNSNDWFTDSEIMIEAVRLNLKVGEIATVFQKNERRKTFVSYATILEFIWNLFKYRFLRKCLNDKK